MARSPISVFLSLLLLLAVAFASAGASTFDDENPIRTVVSSVLHNFETSVVNVIGRSRHAVAFARFAYRYGKSYGTEEEMKLRFWIFSENLKLIKSHNRKGLPYTLGVNHRIAEEYLRGVAPRTRGAALKALGKKNFQS